MRLAFFMPWGEMPFMDTPVKELCTRPRTTVIYEITLACANIERS